MEIKKGNIVLTTCYSFYATVGVIVRCGALPVFIDIDPDTFNISSDALEKWFHNASEEQIQRAKAIIPVHLFGQSAMIDPILDIANRYQCYVIEDTAQAFGTKLNSKQLPGLTGTAGTVGCFSFFPNKNLAALGDAGLVITKDQHLAEQIRRIRFHGTSDGKRYPIIGGNFRIDSLQAAFLLVRSRRLNDELTQRIRIAKKYMKELADTPQIKLPTGTDVSPHRTYNQFVVTTPDTEIRDNLMEYLQSKGISTIVYYWTPLHLLGCLEFLGHTEGDFPVAEKISRQSVALPVSPHLSLDEVEYVCTSIKQFFDRT